MKRIAASVALAALMALSPLFAAHAEPARQDSAADFETRLSTLEDQMRSLNGQFEQIGFAIRRLDQSLQRMQSDNETRFGRIESSLDKQAAAAAAAPPPPASDAPAAPVNGMLGALKLQDGKVTGGVNRPQSPPLPDTPPDYGLTPQEQYDRAFGLLRMADYDEAETAFKSFIDKNPKDKLIDNAKYWYAETLYVRARFQEAATAFADAYQQNPQGSKAPDSLLKLAMSLNASGKPKDACIALNELKEHYPNASGNVRHRASEERAKLKCGAKE